MDITNDEPPKLMKGSGMPVKGSVAVTTATLINAWKMSEKVTPEASTVPKASGESRAMRKPR